MRDRPVMLVFADGGVPTGFSRVARAILEPLVGAYDIHHLAISYSGDPHDYPWKLYPAIVGGDELGLSRVPSLIEHIQPDLIFIINNASAIKQYLECLGSCGHKAKIVAYCPVEGGPISSGVIGYMSGLDRLVLYTDYAQGLFEKALTDDPSVKLSCPLSVIPHGVDTATFAPLSSDLGDLRAIKLAAKRELFGDAFPLEESFIVLNGNRNQPRKRIDSTIEGFAAFAEGKPEAVKLYLHMGMVDVGWDIYALARRWKIDDRLIVTSRAFSIPNIDDEGLNLIYNACDVGINTCSSEGWGLVAFEHAATCSAQIVPNHSAAGSLWQDVAEMLEPALRITEPGSLTDQHLAAPSEIAAKLQKLYDDPELLEERARKAYAHATRTELQWSTIAERWRVLFAQTLAAA